MNKQEKIDAVMKGVTRGLFAVLFIVWMAVLMAMTVRGDYSMFQVLNGVLQAALCLLVWELGRRLERMGKMNALLTEEVQRLSDTKIMLDMLRDIVKQREAEKQVAEKMEEHLENGTKEGEGEK